MMSEYREFKTLDNIHKVLDLFSEWDNIANEYPKEERTFQRNRIKNLIRETYKDVDPNELTGPLLS